MAPVRLRTLLALGLATGVLAGCGDRGAVTAHTAAPVATPTTAVEDPAPAEQPSDEPAGVPVPVADRGLEGFPLADGWPAEAGEPGHEGPRSPVARFPVDVAGAVCDAPLPAAGEAPTLRATYDGPEDHRTRELVAFADADAAVAWAGALSDHLAGCPGAEQVETAVGGESFGTVRFSTDDAGRRTCGLSAVHVVRLGRAVLVDTTAGEGGCGPGGNELLARQQVDRLTEGSAGVVTEMCRFTEAGCAPSDPLRVALDAGWPTRAEGVPDPGTTLPAPTDGPSVVTQVCDAPTPPTSADLLRGVYSSVADHRERELRVFDDADEAVRWTSAATTILRACPEDDDGPSVSLTFPVESAVGGESFGLARFERFDGSRTSYLFGLHVVRVGRAVLVDAAYNEGGAAPGTNPQIARDQVARMTTDSADLVAAMCRFTAAGC